jgi:hypothetical protein
MYVVLTRTTYHAIENSYGPLPSSSLGLALLVATEFDGLGRILAITIIGIAAYWRFS